MGGDKSDPVIYNWVAPSRITLIFPFIPWFILFLFLIRSFRQDKKAWAILIPLLFCEIMLLGISKILSLIPARYLGEYLYSFFNPMLLSCAAISLVSDSFKQKRGLIIFSRALMIFWGIGIASISILNIEESSEKLFIIPFYGIATLVILLSIVLARFFSRKGFKMIRFSFLMLISNIIIIMIFILAFTIILNTIYYTNILQDIWIQISIAVVLSLILFGSILPFLIFFMKNQFFRERLAWILQIPGIVPGIPLSEGKTDAPPAS